MTHVFAAELLAEHSNSPNCKQAIKNNRLNSTKKKRVRRRYYLDAPFSDIYLTERQVQMALCLMEGKTSVRIAKTLHISPRTVEFHVVTMRENE